MTEPDRPRVALYARYSSDLQSAASIEDQLRLCHARAEREGWPIVATFKDAAISGATTDRPGYQALLSAIRAGKVGLILAESLDRFSRDLEHVAAFYKLATFHGVRIVTLAEGPVSELQVGFKGTMGAAYLADLAAKTRRGQEGRVRKGFAFGPPAYGYRKVRQFDANGDPVLGQREIDPAQATVVRRIFDEYVVGRSPREIAAALNAEGVPGPAGTPWYDTTIRGRPTRDDGLLRNPIYVGRMRWNRSQHLRNPETGRHVRRRRSREEMVEVEVPHLRIVNDAVWDRARARLSKEAAPPREGAVPAFWERRRARHLLTGKVQCASCGGQFAALGRDYLGCQRARRGKGCANTRRVRRAKLEAMVMEALGARLMRPDRVAAFCKAFIAEWNRAQAEVSAETGVHKRELREAERKLNNLVRAITSGVWAPSIQKELDALEARRAQLQAALDTQPAHAPALHPNLADVYARRVEVMRTAIEARNEPELLEAARALVDKVIVGPGDGPGDPPAIELVGHLTEMLRAGGAHLPQEDAAANGILEAVTSGSAKGGLGGSAPPAATDVTFTSPAFPIAVALAIAPLAVVLQSKAMAPVALVALLLCVVASWRQDRALPWPRGAAVWAAVALGVWGVVSAAWAIEPGRAVTTGLSMAGMALLAGGAAQALAGSDGMTRARLVLVLAVGLALGLVAATVDTLSGNAIRAGVRGLRDVPVTLAFGLKPAGSVMALFLPLLAALPWPVLPRVMALAAGAAVLILLPGDTAKIAALLGLVAAGAAWVAPRAVPRLVGAGLASVILAMPLLVALVPAMPLERLPQSAMHRMLIWDFAAERIAERPLLGWGMEASREIPGGRDQPSAAALDRMRVTDPAMRRWFGEPHVNLLPLHPHNGALQLWLELGAVGAAIAALLAWFLGVAAARAPSPAAATGALVSAAVTAMLSFGAWQAWWVAAMLLATVAAAGLPRAIAPDRSRR